MSERVEDLTIRYEVDGIEIIKELDKCVLSKGSWATVMFKYQEWHRSEEVYGVPKVSIRRYQKQNNSFRQKSKFNITSTKQILRVVEVLQDWFLKEESQGSRKKTK